MKPLRCEGNTSLSNRLGFIVFKIIWDESTILKFLCYSLNWIRSFASFLLFICCNHWIRRVLITIDNFPPRMELKFKMYINQVTMTAQSYVCGYIKDGLSHQALNPDSKVRPSLKKPKNPILWTGADTIITWATTTPPHPPNNFSAWRSALVKKCKK